MLVMFPSQIEMIFQEHFKACFDIDAYLQSS